jgi:hypothetical protein
METKVDEAKQVALKSEEALPVIAALDKKLKAMEKIRATTWKTNGKVSEDFPNIRSEKDNGNLQKALSVVRVRAEAYNLAGEAPVKEFGLGLNSYEVFKHNGYTLAEWHHDIFLRYQINNQEEIETKIKKHRDALQEFVSKEERKANAMKNIIADFGEDFLQEISK